MLQATKVKILQFLLCIKFVIVRAFSDQLYAQEDNESTLRSYDCQTKKITESILLHVFIPNFL